MALGMLPDTLRVLEWPLVEPVTLTEAKLQIGLSDDQTDYDRFVLDKIAAARRIVEQRLGITLVATKRRATWKTLWPRPAPTDVAAQALLPGYGLRPMAYWSNFNGRPVISLPAPPLLLDEAHPLVVTANGNATTSYTLDEDAIPATLTFTADVAAPVVVTYWAGVTEGARIDPLVRSAILSFVRHQFDNRGIIADDGNAELPQAFEAMLAASSWNVGW